MEVGNNRRRSTSSSRSNNGVVVATGSVWENRMKHDEVKGGFKVFSNNNNDETPNENDDKDCNFISGSTTQVDKRLDMGPKKTNIGVVGVSGKRKTWKTESSPIQIASKRSELSKNLDEKCDLSKNLDEKCDFSQNLDDKCKDLSNNLDEKCKDLSVSVDGVVGITRKTWKSDTLEGSPIQIASKRSDLSKNLDEKCGLSKNLDGKCDLSKKLDEKCKDLSKSLDEKYKDLSFSDNGVVGLTKKTGKVENFEGNSIQIASKRSDLSKNLDEKCEDLSKNLGGKCDLSKNLDEKCDLSKNLDEKSKDLSVSDNGVVGITRRTWKTESFEGTPIQIASKKSDLSKNLDEKSKDLSKNLDEKCKDLSVSDNGVVGTTRKTWKSESLEGNSIQIASKRSDLSKNLDEKYKDLSKFFDEKCKDLSKNLDEKCKDLSVSADRVCKKVPNQSKKNSELRKLKSESVNGNVKKSNLDVRILKKPDLEESSKNLEGSIGIKKTKSEEFGMCEEKFITSNVVSEAKSANKLEKNLENEDDNEEWDDVLEEEIDEEIGKRSVDVKEIRVQEQNKPKKIVIEEKKFQYNNKRQIPISSINKKQSPPTLVHAKIHPSPTRTKSVPVSDEFQSRKHSKLQSLVDLVMWRNVSKSALVFGIGTFVIISSSYTQDLNISFISVLSCLGLVYLAAIFLFRSLIHRREVDIGESSEYVVGEEEAVWVLKLILPFINEFLLKIRALFCGDPSTTMKMAVLLFLLAKFGSYITIWKLSKLGFFGVFVIPKVCSSYSAQLTSYGTFLIRYIRDAWESCSHKKAVGFAIFTLVWNFSSIIARIWAVFMLYVGFRYYQQTLMREDTIKADDFLQGKIREQRQVGRKPNSMDTRKQKKAF